MIKRHCNSDGVDTRTEKRCGRCKETKQAGEFGKTKGNLNCYCKVCHRLYIYSPDLRTEKPCACCKKVFPVVEFSRLGVRYQPYCKACQSHYGGTRYLKLVESGEARTIDRDDYWARRKWLSLKIKYGITKEQYKEMYLDQDGKCAICKRHETDQYKGTILTLTVDHDHDTGKVRGLLCRLCNIALGRFREEILVLKNAIAYLERNGKLEK